MDWEEIPVPDPVPITPANNREGTTVKVSCPLCTSFMQLRHAGRGGYFYGCSEWPACKGQRSPRDKRPGPKAVITALRKIIGDQAWEAMDRMKRGGLIPKWPTPSSSRKLETRHFCGMDPSDHLGRNCPLRRGQMRMNNIVILDQTNGN